MCCTSNYCRCMNSPMKPNQNCSNRWYKPAGWGVYSLCSLIFAFSLSWLLLSKVDFAYGWLHDVLDIQQHSEHYGPLNRFRDKFETTDRAEHIRLFGEINEAVHQSGQGLGNILYYGPDGQVIDTLLHNSEQIHLQDVAHLLDNLKPVVIGVSLFWLMLAGLGIASKIALPSFKQQGKSVAVIGVFVAVVLIIKGPESVFYVLHEWVFPAGHQWYFFYEDSLMSTMMKAPDLFGAIAILLTLLAMVVFMLANGIVQLWRTLYQIH
jgi:hypothetical protein